VLADQVSGRQLDRVLTIETGMQILVFGCSVACTRTVQRT
jgi:hypothetical protein